MHLYFDAQTDVDWIKCSISTAPCFVVMRQPSGLTSANMTPLCINLAMENQHFQVVSQGFPLNMGIIYAQVSFSEGNHH